MESEILFVHKEVLIASLEKSSNGVVGGVFLKVSFRDRVIREKAPKAIRKKAYLFVVKIELEEGDRLRLEVIVKHKVLREFRKPY